MKLFVILLILIAVCGCHKETPQPIKPDTAAPAAESQPSEYAKPNDPVCPLDNGLYPDSRLVKEGDNVLIQKIDEFTGEPTGEYWLIEPQK